MPAGTECDCTAQLLRSYRALYVMHRNAQRHQVTRRGVTFDELTYLCADVVVIVVEDECVLTVAVVGVVKERLR
jgi:hypothetical protein